MHALADVRAQLSWRHFLKGQDHHLDCYREMPMVTEGAFGFSSNAMYSFAFLAL
jgi:hypothetical protein